MAIDLFEDLGETSGDPEVVQKPFYKILEKNNDKMLLEWLNGTVNALIEESRPRTHQQRDNLMLYRGVESQTRRNLTDGNRGAARNYRKLNKVRRFIVNHLFDLTETKVSQMTRIKPNVEVLPTNDEWEDRASAKVVSSLIKHLWYINNIDFLTQNMQRYARIFGEAFTFLLWDEDKGDLSPLYVAAKEVGREKEVEKKFLGDVCYEVELPWRTLLHRTDCIDKSEYVIRVKVEPTEKLKTRYPKVKDEIEVQDDIFVFDVHRLNDKFIEQHSVTYTMYHKNTKEVGDGYFAKWTKDVLLETKDKGFLHGELPIVRLTDLDVPEVLNGVSRYETVGPMQRMHNNLSSLAAKSIYLGAHPKWMMPRGAAKIEQLGNDSTVVQFQGAIAPVLVTPEPMSKDAFAFRQNIKEEMQTVYGSHGISRGEIPKGITAASALQFLNELESERASTDIAKHSFMIRDLARLTAAVAGEFYDTEDGRMVRIVGENNKFLIRHFDAAHLHKSYDIRFDNSTGLPDTKSAKIQRILEAMQRNPTMLSPGRWEELLELGNTEKMHSLISEAIRSADSENEDLLSGFGAEMPEEWEDHIQHWDSHVKAMQSRQFKSEADPVARAALKDHVFWTEELMIEKFLNNPEFEARVATLTLFPVFFHKSYISPARSLEQQLAQVQGAANRGAETDNIIPGTNPQEAANAQRILKGGK